MIYFFRPVGLKGPIKIGSSEAPRTRLEQMAVWSPFELEMIGSIPGEISDERFLHDGLAESHRHREWFDATSIVLRAVEEAIDDGSLERVRSWLKPSGKIRAYGTSYRSPEMAQYRRYLSRVNTKERKGERPPPIVTAILSRWSNGVCKGGDGFTPSHKQISLLEGYIGECLSGTAQAAA